MQTYPENKSAIGITRLVSALFLLLVLLWPLSGLTQSAIDGYHPDLDGQVNAMVLQDDGKLLIGGSFTSINGTSRPGLARLHPNGSLDTSFNAQLANGSVWAIALQDNGQILIGGTFTQVGISQRNRIARLNSNGSLDAAFNPNASDVVLALAVQSDGRILVGGAFGTISGASQARLARLNVNGSLDANFAPVLGCCTVWAIRIQSNGRVLVGGTFETINGDSHPRIARLQSNGNPDSSFFANADASIRTIDLQLDGRILIGGAFSTVNGSSRAGFARLMSNGDLDFSMTPYNFNGIVFSVRALMDGRVLVSGNFNQLNGNPCLSIAIFHYFGELDHCLYGSYSSGTARATAEQTDGKIVIGTLDDWVGDQRLYRWDQLSQRDANSWTQINGPIHTLAVDPVGRVLIGGQFTRTSHIEEARNLARLGNEFTNQDPGFGNPDPDNQVSSLTVQPDGKVLVGGYFNNIHDQSRPYLARLLDNGNLDAAFNPAPDGAVLSTLVQHDSRILVAGEFDQIGGAPRRSLARLHPDGSLDAAFDVPVDDHEALDGRVVSMALQPDGRILIGGSFSMIGDSPRNRLARLHSDGSLDNSFVALGSISGFVTAIHVLGDGRILFSDGGSVYRLHGDGSVDNSFSEVSINGSLQSMLVTADNRVILGGLFTAVNGTPRMHLARIEANGSLDTAFLANASGQNVYALAQHTDGRLLVGGNFSAIAGTDRAHFVRLRIQESAQQKLAIEGDKVRWLIAGATQQPVMAPELQFSFNGNDFNTIASMQPIDGGWQVAGFEPPYQQAFYLRVRVPVQQGHRNGSMGLTYSPVRQFYLTQDRIFSDRFQTPK